MLRDAANKTDFSSLPTVNIPAKTKAGPVVTVTFESKGKITAIGSAARSIYAAIPECAVTLEACINRDNLYVVATREDGCYLHERVSSCGNMIEKMPPTFDTEQLIAF